MLIILKIITDLRAHDKAHGKFFDYIDKSVNIPVEKL